VFFNACGSGTHGCGWFGPGRPYATTGEAGKLGRPPKDHR
jgi:hypothetical protein